MAITIHEDVVQGSDDWYALRCGMLTASEMKLIITPAKLAYASNDKERQHLYELAAQRMTKYVEPHYISDDMIRGHTDEIEATRLYSERYAPVQQVGFITNDKWGFTLGCSPDGVVGKGGIENKSRKQKYQMETIVTNKMPDDYLIQVQTIMAVAEWQWCDFNSFCAGMPMKTIRVYPDPKIQNAILECASTFEERMSGILGVYGEATMDAEHLAAAKLIPTERKSNNLEEYE